MNIVYNVDKKFFPQLCISVISLLNNTNVDTNIFVITDDISDYDLDKLRLLIKGSFHKIRIKKLSPYVIHNKLKTDRGSLAQYYRLFISETFSMNNIDIKIIKRVIFLDADTLIVNTGVEKLFKINLEDNVIGACLDPWAKLYRPLFKLNKSTPMFNSGVLVIDLIKWDSRNISKKLYEIINNRAGFFSQADQGILNELFEGKFKILPMSYNITSVVLELSYKELMIYRKPQSFYTKQQYNLCKNRPVVVHFTSSFLDNRPWEFEETSNYGAMWRTIEYQSNLPIYKYKKINLVAYIYRKLPKTISLQLLGLLQAYMRPILLTIKRM